MTITLEQLTPILSSAIALGDNKDISDLMTQLYNKSNSLVISDARRKIIEEALGNGNKLPSAILQMVAAEAGNSPEGYGLDAMTSDDSSVVNAYANHIKNYLYTYKDEATAIDPSIDPSEKQIGPMAQDIEQVNPACVKQLPDGTKVVDTEKLALMNAGAIADLARDISSIKEMLNGR